MAQSLEDLIRKIKDSVPAFAQIAQEATLVKGQEILGQYTNRIFNQGKATDGTQIGQYDDKKKQTFLTAQVDDVLTKKAKKKIASAEKKDEDGVTYKDLREAQGLQTEYVDLQFSGQLFHSINIGLADKEIVLGFTNADRAKIAGYQEVKWKKPIFKVSDEELKQAVDTMTDYTKDRVREIIREKWL